MWIKEPNKPLGQSLNDKLNFLYKSEKIYIMDNHLAAGWSWLNILNIEQKYNLIHIDRHYDLLDSPNTIQKQIIDKNIKLHTLSLQEYLDLEKPIGNDQFSPVFLWDNYILNLNILYPNLFNEKYFSTHEKGNKNPDFITEELKTYDLIYILESIFEDEELKEEWIVNIDLDYFFGDSIDNSKIKLFSKKYIIDLFTLINQYSNKIAVITICLSPECCGGWDKSFEILEIAKQIFNIDFKIE